MVVEGVGNLMHHIARCCQPIPGNDIVGFITQRHGISIHRADCDQLASLIFHAPERIVYAVWGESYPSGYSLVVRVTANDRSGLLRDITTILANEKVNVLGGVSSRSDTKKQLATIDMDIEIYNPSGAGTRSGAAEPSLRYHRRPPFTLIPLAARWVFAAEGELLGGRASQAPVMRNLKANRKVFS